MAIFTRRRIQGMLNDLTPLLDSQKRSDLVRRLNNKRVEQALPAEMELALTWAMKDLDCIEIEPEWWVNGKEPDVYVEGLVTGMPAIVEIASPNDNSISGEQLMDKCSQQIIEYANSVKRGFGNYLYFSFAETKEYKNGINIRGIAAPKGFTLSDSAKTIIKNWILSDIIPRPLLKIEECGLDVAVEKREYKQIRYHNFWTTRPPRTYSETENPIYNILREKLSQVEDAPSGTCRIIFLAEVGSRTLDEMGQRFRNNFESNATAEKIIRRFMVDKRNRVDAIVVFLPQKKQRGILKNITRSWKSLVFTNEEIPGLEDSIFNITKRLPLPRFTGSQARSLFRQGAFSHKARGWYLGTSMTSIKDEITYRISSRVLLDFLAGRITETQLRYFMGERDDGPSISRFLDRGFTVGEISFEKGGVDEDDDLILLHFSKDPAAHPFE